jgi:hypothetical protein
MKITKEKSFEVYSLRKYAPSAFRSCFPLVATKNVICALRLATESIPWTNSEICDMFSIFQKLNILIFQTKVV